MKVEKNINITKVDEVEKFPVSVKKISNRTCLAAALA